MNQLKKRMLDVIDHAMSADDTITAASHDVRSGEEGDEFVATIYYSDGFRLRVKAHRILHSFEEVKRLYEEEEG